MKKNIWREGMMGLIVGDALGWPVQFLSRDEIKNRPEGPVTGMESGGVYHTPPGTWTDDSSMSIATMASILEKGDADPVDIMQKFVAWETKGEYTPSGVAFDQGMTCLSAIYKFKAHPDINHCGATGDHANGNGALMRIMPACLYYYERQKKDGISDDEVVEAIHIISGLTHNHLRSKMCCVIYYFCVKSIIDGMLLPVKQEVGALLQAGVDAALKYYGRDTSNDVELAYLRRLFHLPEFKEEPEEKIRTTGYVIHTTEAVFWCLLNSNSFRECLVKAVNLGDDADTIGAIAGGLAALYYGYEDIPLEWLSVIKRKEWIEEMCDWMDRGNEYTL